MKKTLKLVLCLLTTFFSLSGYSQIEGLKNAKGEFPDDLKTEKVLVALVGSSMWDKPLIESFSLGYPFGYDTMKIIKGSGNGIDTTKKIAIQNGYKYIYLTSTDVVVYQKVYMASGKKHKSYIGQYTGYLMNAVTGEVYIVPVDSEVSLKKAVQKMINNVRFQYKLEIIDFKKAKKAAKKR